VVAVMLGLVLACCGVLVGLDATRRLARSVVGGRTPLVPFGILAVLVVPSFWDFATSGLETGLEMFWIGTSWSILVRAYLRTREGGLSRRSLYGAAVWFGLFPLVRPDLGLSMIVFLAVLLVLGRAGWRRGALMVAAAAVLPVGYQIFRMGYYGLIVPMPGVTKEASSNLWNRGLIYLTDFAKPNALWLPATLAVLFLAVAAWRLRPSRHLALVVGAPMLAGVLQGVYVLKVGGDFMHGRMWLPVLVLGLLPVLLVPLTKLAAPAVVAFGAWTVLGIADFRTAPDGTCKPGFCWVWNERQVYVTWTGVGNPDRASIHDHSPRDAPLRTLVAQATAGGGRYMVFDPHYIEQPAVPLAPGRGGSVGVVIGTLGAGGLLTPIDGTVIDVWGLGNTIGAHIDIPSRGAAGHEKLLPEVWNLALYADPADDAATLAALPRNSGVTAQQLAAARHVLQCGQVKDLLDSISQPMTPGRFWDNITGSLSRTDLRIPANPIVAEQQFCH
jgi:arabinofuranosyltransferase